MEENTSKLGTEEAVDTEVPLDKNVRLMSPTRMVVRRFIKSKLRIVGLIMVIGLSLAPTAIQEIGLDLAVVPWTNLVVAFISF